MNMLLFLTESTPDAGTTGNGQELSRRHAKSDIPEGFHR